MLNITPANEPLPIEHVAVVIYGQPGTGKSSFAFTCKNPLTFDFDNGAHRSEYRQDVVQVSAWQDVASITADDLKPYDTVVVDTVGTCLDALTVSIISGNAKLGYNGNLNMQGWGQLKTQFVGWLKLLRGYGKDVVLIAHETEDKRGDEVVKRPKISGGSYAEVMQVADGVGYLSIINKNRVLDFNPTDIYTGKNPAQFEPLSVPHFNESPDYGDSILTDIKARIGQISERGKAIAQEVAKWRDELNKCEDTNSLNEFVGKIKDTDSAISAQVRPLFTKRVTELGYTIEKGVVTEKAA